MGNHMPSSEYDFGGKIKQIDSKTNNKFLIIFNF
tara:strand:- start:599 stop:700 length:102 start_codon:yes stop_codon:yes gene_type:complete